MSIYRDKDVVEKGFLGLKYGIEFGRLRVHSDNTMQGKLFVGFVASVIMSSINKVMAKSGLYEKYNNERIT